MSTVNQISVVNSTGRYLHVLTTTVTSQDVQANTSTVYFEYRVYSQVSFANGSWTTLNDTEFNAIINGISHTNSPNFDFRVSKEFLMVSGYETIAHGTNGTLSLSVGLTGATNPGSIYFTAVSISSSFSPPAIPRASTVSVTPNPVVEGGEVTINLVRANAGFTHDITWQSGVSSGTVGTGVGTSTTWTPSPALLDGATRVPITLSVQTKNGATAIGDPVLYDLIMVAMPTYPEIGQGTPYDLRFRRTEMDGDDWVQKESIPFIEATITEELSATGTCSLTISTDLYPTTLDEAVIVADVYDGAQWLNVGFVYVLIRVQDDSTDETNVVKYTGMSYVDYILSKGLVEEDKDWNNTNPGTIIGTYMETAQSRGWGVRVDKSFTDSVTSLGTPWQGSTTIKATKNTPISQMLDGFVSDALCEYRTRYDATDGVAYLEIYNPGYGFDWSVAGANPIINLSTTALNKVADRAPVRKDFSDKLTRVSVSGDESSIIKESASSVNPLFGHLEGSVNATGIKDTAQLSQLGEVVLSQNFTATVERTFNYDLSSAQTPSALYPYRTFRAGDWILVPGDTGPERSRIAQVSITRDVDGTKATITMGDLIPSGVAATARKLSQSGGGAIAGGTLRTPLPLSSAIPAAPEGLSATPDGYWNVDGSPASGVEVSWSPVTTSLEGTSIIVDLYEVWSREEVGSPWSLATLSDLTVTTISGLQVDTPMDIRVRARSLDGIYGAYSDEISIVTAAPTVDLGGPIMTDLYTDGVGSIYAVWAGVLGTDPAPARLAYVGAEISADGGVTYVPAGTPIVASGTIVINPNAWGDFDVRLRGYDRLGNAGDASDPETITLVDPHISPAIPELPTGFTATAGASWDASGFFPLAWFDLTWDAVTLDTGGNVIDVVGYDIWGKPSTETDVRYLTSSATNSVRWVVDSGEVWSFQVSASSEYGGVSGLSAAISETADAVISAAPAPDAPTLDQYAGILRINWSGNGMLPQIKYVYATISTDTGGPFTRAGMPLQGAGEVVVPGLAPDVTYYAKIVMVAEDGTLSTSAVSDGLTLLPITGVTFQTSPVANTGIKITSGSLTAYDGTGQPTFILDAATGEVWIAPYDAVFAFGSSGTEAETGTPTTGLAISSESSSFNTFIHPSGVQIRNDQTPLSWWEADPDDSSLVNFVSPRSRIGQRLRVGDFEFLKEVKTVGSRVVIRYVGA